MGKINFTLILAAEALIVCLFLTILLLLKNRHLKHLIAKLKAQLKELAARLKNLAQPTQTQAPPETPYRERLDEQLANTKDYHVSLGTRQDIALDLDPDSPLPRRTAAIRHAFLIAEKEATANEPAVNWDFLASRYQQLLAFNEDYAPQLNEGLEEDLAQTQEELEQAKKRISNLERFKQMYFELEERWNKCKNKADEHYSELQILADKSEQPEDFRSLLEQYHSSYGDIGDMIERGTGESPLPDHHASPDSQLHELRRLRSVAADQHRIISELQQQLSSTTFAEQQAVVVESLQTELTKQARFLKESETCIQLMEDELANANRELEQLRARASQAAAFKNAMKDLQEAAETHEQIVGSLKQENRRLAKKLKLTQDAPPEDSQENRALRKELTTLQGKYNDLEEKFLNLKLKE